MVIEYGGATPPVEGTNCARSPSVTRHLGQFEAEDGSGPRFDPDFMHPERHATACGKPQNAQQTRQTTQQRNDTDETRHNEATPGTPDPLSPAPECTKSLGSGTTNCLPGTPLPPPKA